LAVAKAFTVEVPEAEVLAWYHLVGWKMFLSRIHLVPPAGDRAAIHILQQEHMRSPADLPRRAIVLSKDFYSRTTDLDTIVMPYFCYPQVYQERLDQKRHEFRRSAKAIKILFAGSWIDREYGEYFHFPMMNRSQVLTAVADRFADRLVIANDPDILQHLRYSKLDILFSVTNDPTPLADNHNKHALPLYQYLGLAARSWFFLCPPGVEMPFSHNLYEAMLVGAIPILNYADYLTPRLEDGINCLTFSTPEELLLKVEEALTWNEARLLSVRNNVIQYYERHLDPARFGEKLKARVCDHGNVRVLVNDEDVSVRSYLRESRDRRF
jgi:hypothetical protein